MAGLVFNQIKLVGFKSFVDPTDFVIEPGLTGIVGPNGCGKSNLLEAIRWVMGANSAKAMRAKGMDDVIFNGTKSRPGRNQAHVTLSIDNKSRVAPSMFNDHDDLEVSRIITAGKGSTYKVNGKTVRAKDVQLLFADASTGANSPALVRQGQISELIAAKPSNRRRILEEAAGISGLHTRRHEAELRLRAAETNLERLDDVINQIESQLASLRRQSRQAARYKRLAGEIHEYKALLWLKRWRNALELLSGSEVDLKARETEVVETAKTAAELTSKVAAAAQELDPKREEQLVSAAVLARLNASRDALESDEAKAKADIEKLISEIEQITRDIDRETDISSDADDAMARLKSEQAHLTGLDNLDEAIALAKTASDEAIASRSSLETDYTELTRRIAEQSAQRQSIDQDLSRVVQRLNKLQSDLGAQTAKLERVNASKPDSTQNLFMASLTEAQSVLTAQRESQTQLQTKLLSAENEESDTRDHLNAAQNDLNKLTAERNALQQIVIRETESQADPVIDALEVTRGYETALAVSLGDDLEVPIAAQADMSWRGADLPIQELPKLAKPLSEFVKAPRELQARLSQIGVVEQDQLIALKSKLKPGQRIVTLEGHLMRWDGFEIKAGAETSAAIRLKQLARLEDLKVAIADNDSSIKTVRASFEKAKAVRIELRQALKALRETLPGLERKARDAQASLSRFETETVRHEAETQAINERISNLESDIADVSRLKTQQEALAASLADGPDYSAEQTALSEKLVEARQKADETGAHYRSLVNEAKSRQSRLDNISTEMQNWEKRQSNAKSRLESLNTRLIRTKDIHLKVTSGPDEFKTRRDNLFAEIETAEARRDKAADELASIEALVRSLENQARDAEGKHSTARENRAASQARLLASRERIEEIKARITETLSAEPDGLTKLLGELSPDSGLGESDIEKKLERLQKERERMGGVNLRADIEAEEQEEQLVAMNDERADLIAAIARLREGIDELNSEGRTRLLNAFDIVNGHFGRLFQTLFGGGEAALTLTESDDPLEAGLEIMVSPPGKKLGSMSLMSGGEQALTATALIFAVFLSNPAPICVLDEVDAPLDDANVSRYCDLLDEMTKQTNTKFIAITHNAVTMSRMDRLFGVTMAEQGVSQLLSMELSNATRLVAAE